MSITDVLVAPVSHSPATNFIGHARRTKIGASEQAPKSRSVAARPLRMQRGK